VSDNNIKILLITSSTFNSYTGTGILLTNLFRIWSRENLAMIHYDSFNPLLYDKNICANYYGLDIEEKRFIWPLSIFGKKHHDRQLKSKNITSTGNKKIYTLLLKLLGGEEIIKKITVSSKMIKWIEKINPDIIYCHISSLNQINFIIKLHSIFKIPVVIHIMDDPFNAMYKKGLFSLFLRYYFFKNFKKLLSISSIRMGIGEKMCKHYEHMFHYSFVPFSNTIETNKWSVFKDRKTDKKIFNIVYAGTINSKNINGLEILCKIVGGLNLEGLTIQFKIYTFQPRLEYYRSSYEKSKSIIMDEVPNNDDEMAYILGTADLLFLPIDFTKRSIDRMRYSIYAKIPAYLASGTPILFFGPSEIASIEYAKKEKWAYVVDKNDKNLLRDGLLELISNTKLKDSISKNAFKIAHRDFEASNVRQSFRRTISEAIRK